MMRQLIDRLRNGRTQNGRRRVHKTAALAVILATFSAIAIVAWADAPDPVLPLHGFETINSDGSITLAVDGGWAWTTHKSDCNLNRYATGWAVDWNDQSQAGGVVGTVGGVTVDVGVAAANQYNPKDLNTHFYDGPNPPRCGVYDPGLGYNTGLWGPGTVHGRTQSLIKYPQLNDNGNLVDTKLYESHTYPPGTTVVAPCVVTYDIHGSLATGPKSGDLIAGGQGHAGDNSVQSNKSTPLGNGCFTFNFPILTSNASFNAQAGTITDTAHLTGATSDATGTITFKLYGPDDTNCSGQPNFPAPFVSTASVHGSGDYHPASDFTPTSPGTYRWTMDYDGDAKNAAAHSSCNAPNESVTVDPHARITIDPAAAANQVNHDHVFTITVTKQHSGAANFVPASGVSVTAAKDSGPGAFKNGVNTCTTDNNGQCQVTLQSADTGLTVVSASAPVSVDGQTLNVSTNGQSGNSSPAKKRWTDARLTVTPPQAANQVGQTHTFTAHLLLDHGDGAGLVPAPAGETIHLTKASGPGTLSANSCTTVAGGTCTVDLISSVTGLTTVDATWSGLISTTAEGSASASASSADAVKRWADAQLTLTPGQAANQIGATHTFTATLKFDFGDGAGFVSAGSGKTITLTKDSGPGTLSANSCTTIANGTCTVDLTSSVTGLTTVHANWSGGIATAEGTAQASTQSSSALKRWTDAHLTLDPSQAANQIGVTHTFTAHLTFDKGDGAGFVNAPAGATINVSKVSGPGTLSAASCTTVAGGTCTVDLTSSVTGLTTVHASWTGGIVTAEGTAQASTSAPNAVKRWTDAHLDLTPNQAANQVGVVHTFTAHLTLDHGNGVFVDAAAGETINFTKVSGPGNLSAASCNTVAGGTCTVDLTSSVTGLTTVKANWSGTIGTAEGNAAASTTSNNAVKQWTDARLTLDPPTAVNRIGDPHVFTAHLMLDHGDGAGFVDGPAGETINVSKVSGPGTLSANSCTTIAGGTCTVTLNSTQTGTTQVSASWGGLIVTANGSANATANADAEKVWVDALILINPPTATNEVNNNHVFTITVKKVDNGTVSPADGVLVQTSKVSGPGAFVGASTCTTDLLGQCTVTLVSSQTGLTTVSASADVVVNGKTVKVATDGTGNNAPPAVKRWVNARLTLTPPDAVNKVNDTHVFTAHLEIDFGNGAGFVDGTGEQIDFTKVSGPGTLSAANCVTNASGECTVNLDSSVAGATVVKANWTGQVTTAEGSATMTKSADGNKLWIDPAITIDKKVEGADHKPVADALQSHEGDTLHYTVVVSNTGDTPLTISGLSDTVHNLVASDCDHFNGYVLPVGGSINCAYTDTAPASDVHNVASVVGSYDVGQAPNNAKGDLTASDETFVKILHPAIDIVKSGAALAHEGDTVTYKFDVTNTGDVDLTQVAVTDDVLGNVGTIGDLAVGVTKTVTKDFVVPANVTAVKNIGTACGVDAGNVKVCDTDPHTLIVIHPEIQIVKDANPTTAEPGNTVTYTYQVTNLGDTTLTNVVVTDDIIGDVGTIASLAVGETQTLTKSFTVASDSPRTNIGTACGSDALSRTVCDTDPATISIVLPIPPQHRLPKTGFQMLLWISSALTLLAAGLAMVKTRREWLRIR